MKTTPTHPEALDCKLPEPEHTHLADDSFTAPDGSDWESPADYRRWAIARHHREGGLCRLVTNEPPMLLDDGVNEQPEPELDLWEIPDLAHAYTAPDGSIWRSKSAWIAAQAIRRIEELEVA